MIIIILFLGLIIRLLGLNQSLWLDEAAQAIESIRPLGQQLDIAGDFWPPLFHLLLHFWMVIGTNDGWLRLLSIILGMSSLVAAYKLAQQFLNKTSSLLFVALLSFSPFHVWYSQEIRPYMLMTLLGTLSTFFLLKKNRIAYIFTSILFIYSNYLATFLLLGHGLYIFLFERNNIRNWLTAQFIIYLTFLPWLPAFWQQLQIGKSLTFTLPGWSEVVSTPLIKALPLVFAKFSLGRITFFNKSFYALLIAGLGVGYGALFINSLQKKLTKTIKILVLFLVPFISVFLFSFFLPILAPQRVLFLLPFFYLIMASGFSAKNKVHLLSIGVYFGVAIYSLWLYNTNPQFQRENWREAVKFVKQNSTSVSFALFVFPDAFAPWKWYSQDTVPYLALAPTFTVKQSELLVLKTIAFTNKLFLFHYLTDLTDPNHYVINYIQGLGFTETSKHDFPGVGFISIYEKTVAKI